MRKRKKKLYDDDDGRVISPMNVDGMPWSANNNGIPSNTEDTEPRGEQLELTHEERRAMMSGVFAAALLVAGIFVVVGFLFVLFCIFVWLK